MDITNLSHASIMDRRLACLFVEKHNRISGVNDWRGGIVPRFFLGRTSSGHVWRFRSDVPKALCDEISLLCEQEPLELRPRPKYRAEYIRLLSPLQPSLNIWQGPAYYFDVIDETILDTHIDTHIDTHVETLLLTAVDQHLFKSGLMDWYDDVPHQQPFAAVFVDGKVVAVCASVRITESVHEAGVETHPDYRFRGYGHAAVLAWAQAVRKVGALPVYSTSQDNLASQALADSMGLVQYGMDFHLT